MLKGLTVNGSPGISIRYQYGISGVTNTSYRLSVRFAEVVTTNIHQITTVISSPDISTGYPMT
jgi:hypothetical protein